MGKTKVEHLSEDARYGGIAQLGERLLCKQEVNGSIPFISTKGDGVGTEAGEMGL